MADGLPERWRLLWTAVCVANVPLPLWIAAQFGLVHPRAGVGVALGSLVLWGAGVRLGRWSAVVVRPLLVGGAALAAVDLALLGAQLGLGDPARGLSPALASPAMLFGALGIYLLVALDAAVGAGTLLGHGSPGPLAAALVEVGAGSALTLVVGGPMMLFALACGVPLDRLGRRAATALSPTPW